ncbi:MAG: fused MFS/spermidine synthase [Eubacterium sp.]|nr:fused MFS/spermidine synthase [Eubacterium sp.]
MNTRRDILKNRTYLYVTEFFSGMAVMAVELAANRLLAPFFSSSQIVWTIIIGTIMIAMALGNVFGGRWADRENDPSRLFRRIIIAAVWISLIPLVGKYIIILITGVMVVAVSTGLLIWASFAACMVIFVYPLFLLGTVTPSLIHYTVSDLSESGSISGRLSACNTIGSIIGTFMPTFVTIPAAGTSATFLIFSGVLLAVGIIYFIANGTGRIMTAVSVVIFVISCVFSNSTGLAFWEKDVVYEGESVYNYLQVKDTEESTVLSTNVMFGVQSIMMKSDSFTGMYYDYAMAAPVICGEENPRVLILGMGTGTYATQLLKYYPDADITGVEIDDSIIELSREYFDLPESVEVVSYDGRAYLNSNEQEYDIIMVDAYRDITIPFQMSTAEFFESVASHLDDDGVMVVNMNMLGEGDESITSYLSDTICTVFGEAAVADVSGNTNRELFAVKGEGIVQRLDAGLATIPSGADALAKEMEIVRAALTTYEPGDRILTDDKAPVELLGMSAMDGLISEELPYYRDMILGYLGL